MTGLIIQHLTTGERQFVFDLAGYDEAEWEVLGIDREPLENEEWDGAQWVLNAALEAARDELAEIKNVQLLRQALKAARNQIQALQSQGATMKNKQDQLIAAVQDLQARVTALEGV